MKKDVLSLAGGDANLGVPYLLAMVQDDPGRLFRGTGVDHLLATYDGKIKVELVNLGKKGSDHHDVLIFILTVALSSGGQEKITVLVWNPWVKQRPLEVAEKLREFDWEHQIDVMILSEAYRLGGVLRHIRGFDLIQGKPGNKGGPESERADVALLIRDDHNITNRGIMRMVKGWAYKGNRKGPRRYPRARFKTESGLVVRVLGFHFPWGTAVNQNGEAVSESTTRVRRWLYRPHK